MSGPTLTYIGVGSNLEEPRVQVLRSARLLDAPDLRVRRRASLYGSRPLGPTDQPDFVNTVLEVESALPPLALLQRCQEVERAMGRARGRRWGPRVIDLDLLLVGALELELPELTLPHPGLPHRSFVLQPLAELIGSLRLPGRRESVSELAARALEPAIWRLEEASAQRSEKPAST